MTIVNDETERLRVFSYVDKVPKSSSVGDMASVRVAVTFLKLPLLVLHVYTTDNVWAPVSSVPSSDTFIARALTFLAQEKVGVLVDSSCESYLLQYGKIFDSTGTDRSVIEILGNKEFIMLEDNQDNITFNFNLAND
jgi:hypothetical protein